MTAEPRPRGRIGDLGPAWIYAIAALITAPAAAGFFAGRATAPSTASAEGNPQQVPAQQTSSGQPHAGIAVVTSTAQYAVDLPGNLCLTFGPPPSRQCGPTTGPFRT